MAFEVFGPEMSAGGRVDQLHGNAQLCARLAQAAFEDVTRTRGAFGQHP